MEIKTLAFFAGFLLLSFSQAQNTIDPSTQKKIDDFINLIYLPIAKVSSLGLTITQNDKLLYSTGYGLANKDKNIPVSNTTQFLLASVTKSFVSVLISKLLFQHFPNLGESALDTPIRILIPSANFTLIDRFRSQYVTFRDLISHRTCLSGQDLILLADPFNSSKEIAYRQRYNPEICGIRTQFQYNNQMYVVAGEMAGLIAGKSFEEAAQDLLNDLGMKNSSFVQKTDVFQQMPRALPYYVKDNQEHPYNEDLIKQLKYSNAAGGLFSTPNDMGRYLRFLLNLGSLDGRQIVPENVMKWLTKASIPFPLYSFKNKDSDKILASFGYGLGLGLGSWDGWEMNHHGGHWPPYTSQLSLFPGKNLGIFSSSNVGPVKASQIWLHLYIFEVLKGNEDAEGKARIALAQLEEEEKMKEEERMKEFNNFYDKMEKVKNNRDTLEGQYGSGSLGEIEITSVASKYYLKYGQMFKGSLEDVHFGVIFKINFDTDMIHFDYAVVGEEIPKYVAFSNGVLYLFQSYQGQSVILGIFVKGLKLEALPERPWGAGSCGPE